MGINPRHSLRRGTRPVLCSVIAFITLAGSSGLTPAVAQTAPPTTVPNYPNFSLSVERGAGTALDITVVNTGPRAIAPPPTYRDSGFSLTLDKGSSVSTYMVAARIAASGHWSCSATYDVIGCSLPGTFGLGQSMTMTVPMDLCYPSGHSYLVLYYYRAALLDQIAETMRLHVLETAETVPAGTVIVLPTDEDPAGVVWQTQQPLIMSGGEELGAGRGCLNWPNRTACRATASYR